MQAMIFMWIKLGAVAWKCGPKLSQRVVTMTWKSLELSLMGRQGEAWSVEQGVREITVRVQIAPWRSLCLA